MIVQDKAISDIKPYQKNPRHKYDINKVAQSIKEFGFQQPIVVDRAGVIIVGHGRYEAAKSLNLKTIPVTIADLSPEKAKAYRIADNKTNEYSDWDMGLLIQEFTDLLDNNYDLELTGFDSDELEKLIVGEKDGLTDEDAVPETPEEPISKLGDIYKLGEHRLMCGDSTSINDVDKLMPNEFADLVFTDPPYNVDYSGRGKNNLGGIKNDKMLNSDFEQFCRDFFTCFFSKMKPLASIYVCHPDSQSAPKIAFEITFAEFFKKSSTIIWMKQSAGMGWQDYRAQHEPILYGWKKGDGKHYFTSDRTKTTIWQFNRDSQNKYVHPTQKPVRLVEEALLNSSKGMDIVMDLFGGSGSTLMACEKNNRKARIMELDPKFVDVIVKRWEQYTGQKAEKIN